MTYEGEYSEREQRRGTHEAKTQEPLLLPGHLEGLFTGNLCICTALTTGRVPALLHIQVCKLLQSHRPGVHGSGAAGDAYTSQEFATHFSLLLCASNSGKMKIDADTPACASAAGASDSSDR